jgi:hypothetical protein
VHGYQSTSKKAIKDISANALYKAIWKIGQGAVLSEEIKSDVWRLAKRVETYLLEKPSRDAGGHIKENLAALRAALE